MATIRLQIDQAQLARLTGVIGAAAAIQTMMPPMLRSLARIHNDLATYPPQAHRRQPPRTDRQRRYVFGVLVKQGLIPYKRTGNLGRKWTSDTVISATGIQGTVGNNTPYAPLVEGKLTQARIHQGIWPTDQDVLDHHRLQIVDDFNQAIDDALRGAAP